MRIALLASLIAGSIAHAVAVARVGDPEEWLWRALLLASGAAFLIATFTAVEPKAFNQGRIQLRAGLCASPRWARAAQIIVNAYSAFPVFGVTSSLSDSMRFTSVAIALDLNATLPRSRLRAEETTT